MGQEREGKRKGGSERVHGDGVWREEGEERVSKGERDEGGSGFFIDLSGRGVTNTVSRRLEGRDIEHMRGGDVEMDSQYVPVRGRKEYRKEIEILEPYEN